MTSTDAFEKLSEHYQTLLDSGHLSDVVLVAGGKELCVHKLILSTRSPVFAAMFAHDFTKEAQENRVEIVDMDEEVLELFVRYIYTGKINTLDQFAADLLIAADKYQVASLKSICVQQLLSEVITTETVSDLLILADMYQIAELANKCLDYITYNGIEVMATEGWKRIRVMPHLLEKLFELSNSMLSKAIDSGNRFGQMKKKYVADGKSVPFNIASFDRIIFKEMSENYESLLRSGIRSDVALVAGEKDLKVHKLILSTRSQVFADMFSHSSTKEAQKNRVEITDMDVEVFELMVRYIYTGKVDHLVQYDTINLFLTADKYHLDGLKSICEKRLMWRITFESVCELLLFADKYRATELYRQCLIFIVNEPMNEYSGAGLLATEGWKNIVVRADLLAQLYELVHLEYSDLMDRINKKKVESNKKKEDYCQTQSRADLLTQLYEHLHLEYSNLMDHNNEKKVESNKQDYSQTQSRPYLDFDRYTAELYVVANKYQLNGLKSICEQELLSEVVTIESVSNLLILADLHQITELYSKCVDYIANNATQVMATEGWVNIQVRTDLLAKICDRLNLNFAEKLLLCPITAESVSNLLILADLHQINQLTANCRYYITYNGTQVMASEGWKRIVVRADLLAMLFEYLYEDYTYSREILLDEIEGYWMNRYEDMKAEIREGIDE